MGRNESEEREFTKDQEVEHFDNPEELRTSIAEILAEETGRDPDEFRADDLPMPDPDELETVPAEEFYGDS